MTYYIISLLNLIMIDCRMIYNIMNKTMKTHSKHEFICFFFYYPVKCSMLSSILISLSCLFNVSYFLLLLQAFLPESSMKFSRQHRPFSFLKLLSTMLSNKLQFNLHCCSFFSFSFLLFPFFIYQLKYQIFRNRIVRFHNIDAFNILFWRNCSNKLINLNDVQ